MSARSRRPDPTPTETLRAAATKLREMAQAATPGPWVSDGQQHVYSPDDNPAEDPIAITAAGSYARQAADALLIATLGPTFAGLVADWLDDAAENAALLAPGGELGPEYRTMLVAVAEQKALKVARHELGEAS